MGLPSIHKDVMKIEQILLGDALEQLRTLGSESVHCCVTSPPYFNLRDYGIPGQIGRERTPEEYIDRLVEVFREVRRVLCPGGTLWLNIGDSYTSGGGKTRDCDKKLPARAMDQRPQMPAGLKPKDLIGIPWMLAFALRSDGWYLRQDIIWHKTRCIPESVRDRCTRNHEYIFLLSKSERYFFDADAVREPVAESTKIRFAQDIEHQAGSYRQPGKSNGPLKPGGNGVTRNKRSVWSVCTAYFRGAHFAVFPEKLVEPCIQAGCPEGGTVLDPFAGSGTTGVVAKRLGRNFIGIELNPEYKEMAAERIGNTEPEFVQLELQHSTVPPADLPGASLYHRRR